MKFTGLEVFDSSIQRTNLWLKDLMQELNWTDHRKTYRAFRCVLHALRDHLSPKDAIYVGNQLPMLIRGFYFDHWDLSGKPLASRNQGGFISVVSKYMSHDGDSDSDAELVSRAVFRLLQRKVIDGEIEDLRHLVPRGVGDLWPPSVRAA
jgi:uncharacterized protein (DUF2267 family)